jgi:site-specific recombinase XerC
MPRSPRLPHSSAGRFPAYRIVPLPPAAPRKVRGHAMVAMLIGCGLRRGELLALNLESVQQREEHWVIADLVGKRREEPGCLGGGPQGRRAPLRILPKANHALLEAKVHNNAEMRSSQRFVPG